MSQAGNMQQSDAKAGNGWQLGETRLPWAGQASRLVNQEEFHVTVLRQKLLFSQKSLLALKAFSRLDEATHILKGTPLPMSVSTREGGDRGSQHRVLLLVPHLSGTVPAPTDVSL